MWLLNDKTWVVFHVAAETGAGFVPTLLLLHRVTGVKNSSGEGRGDGQSLGGFI